MLFMRIIFNPTEQNYWTSLLIFSFLQSPRDSTLSSLDILISTETNSYDQFTFFKSRHPYACIGNR